MDLPPPVQDPEPRTAESRLPEHGVTGADDSLARRLDTIEARLVALGARLEQMEASLHQVIRDEGHTVSTEIRYTLSELGRRLALDLPQTLDRHRQMIVAELRPAGAAEAESDEKAPQAGGTTDDPAAAAAESKTLAGGDGSKAEAHNGDTDDIADAEGDVESDGDSSESSNAGGRRKRRRRRGEG